MRTTQHGAGAIALCLLTACSTNAALAPSDAGPRWCVAPSTTGLGAAGQFFEAWQAAQVATANRCWTNPTHAGELYLSTTLSHHGADIDMLVATGRTLFDPVAAAACLAALDGYACSPDDLFGPGARLAPASCSLALRPTFGGGSGGCISSYECLCNTSFGCPGFCDGADAGPPLSDSGMAVGDCAPSDWPYPCPTGDGVCFALGARPTSCVHATLTAGLGAPCATSDGVLCAPGLVCAHDAGAWVCEMPYPSEGNCHVAIPEGCPAGEVCNGWRCRPLPSPGAPCLQVMVPQTPQCANWGRCDGSGLCTDVGLASLAGDVLACCPTPPTPPPEPTDAGPTIGIDS